jgi:intracellular sulfur oxidation DsrE/DsrF family protein
MIRIMTAIMALFLLSAGTASAQKENAQKPSPRQHKLVIHVDDNVPQKMNLALNNAANVSQYYAQKGEEVEIEIVAYGPGLKMFTPASPVKGRINSFIKSMPNVAFAACGNTMRNMKKKSGKDVVLLHKNIKVVPAGVTRIMELQEQGWSYLKP